MPGFLPLPEIEKFMPLWVFAGTCLFTLAVFIALCIVLVIATRRRRED